MCWWKGGSLWARLGEAPSGWVGEQRGDDVGVLVEWRSGMRPSGEAPNGCTGSQRGGL